MRKIVLAGSNKVKTSPTPGTKAGFVTHLEGPGGITKKKITLGGRVFNKGSIVKNIPGGVFIQDPKNVLDQAEGKLCCNHVLYDYSPKYGFGVRRSEENLQILADVI